MKNLILSGGIFHDFSASSSALADVLKPLGMASRVEPDIERGLASLLDEPVELLTFNALRWEMVGEKYDAYRDEWAMSLSPDGREAIVNHLRQGGALLGLHTASICFSDWPLWGDILGGSWQWGASWHPAPEQIRLTPTAHPLMRGISVFEVVDELYTELSVSPEVETLITGSSASLTGDNPLLWIHRYGGGRVVYDAMGHDAAAIQQAEHAKVLRQSVAWALGIERAA